MDESQCRLSTSIAVLLAVVFLLSRLPFIFSGYGMDPDAYYVALSAGKIWATGRYWLSRPPGYPLFEILCAFFSKGGFLATNGLTALVSGLSIFPLVKILKALRVKNQAWVLLAFCLAPIVWIQSTCTMDYMWALFFVLTAYWFYLSRRYLAGAVFLGLAVGFRLTSALMILPLSLQLFFQERRIKKILPPVFLFILVCLLVYSPVFLTYGLSFWKYVPDNTPFYVWGYRTVSQLLGFPALLILLLGVGVFIFRKPKERLDNNSLVLLLIIVGYGLVFLKLPSETAYLIPIIPFSLILLDRIFPRWLFILFCIFFILNGVVSIATIDKTVYKEEGQLRFIPVDYGTVIKNEIRKRAIYQNAGELLRVAENLHGGNKMAVIIAWYEPVFRFLNQHALEESSIDKHIHGLKARGRNIFFLESVSAGQLSLLLKRRFELYYLDAAREPELLAGVDISKYAKQIPGINSYPVNY